MLSAKKVQTAGTALCLALHLLIAHASGAVAADEQMPLVFVRPVDGAPETWDMSTRVARALGAYNLRAQTGPPDVRGYKLVGRVRPKPESGKDLLFSWELYNPDGDQIRDFVQLTAMSFSGAAEMNAIDVLVKSVAATVAWSVAEQSPAKSAAAAKAAPKTSGQGQTRAASTPARPDAKPATGLTVYWVQVGAFPNQPKAERWYGSLQNKHAEILKSAPYVIIPADLGGTQGIWYRVRVGPFPSAAAAGGMCQRLKSQAVDCFVRKTG